MKPLYSHVDLRVRDRESAVKFYDPLLQALGFALESRSAGDEWPTWRRPGAGRNEEFFGFEVDPDHVPNQNRVAFACASKEEVEHIARVVAQCGAKNIDGPPGLSDRYYACFFDDPDGNRLEACFLSD